LSTIDEQLAWIALARTSLAAAWWRDAVAAVGSARALFECDDTKLRELGLTAAGTAALRTHANWDVHERGRARCVHFGIQIAEFSSDAYPLLLRQIADPPPVLYFCGRPPAAADPAVAIVGSRGATRYGRRTAERIAAELAAAGATVVSGLAYGIDKCAHEGALKTGRSAAVLACGLDKPYPRAHLRLFEALRSSAGVLSEHPPQTSPRKFLFPARNRIVTGMARAVIIVEAAERSGSLISARLAGEQGREVFAVPGNIDSPVSQGTNRLLRDGATPFVETADVLQALELRASVAAPRAPSVRLDDPDAQRVFDALDQEPMHLDHLADACGLDGTRILELLTTLELAGLAERSAGGLFARAQGHIFQSERAVPRRTVCSRARQRRGFENGSKNDDGSEKSRNRGIARQGADPRPLSRPQLRGESLGGPRRRPAEKQARRRRRRQLQARLRNHPRQEKSHRRAEEGGQGQRGRLSRARPRPRR
jgi:DNA processing protein